MSRMPMRCTSAAAKRLGPISLVSHVCGTNACRLPSFIGRCAEDWPAQGPPPASASAAASCAL
eukprot:365442-Chlamydomonas_euryale.AAC.13